MKLLIILFLVVFLTTIEPNQNQKRRHLKSSKSRLQSRKYPPLPVPPRKQLTRRIKPRKICKLRVKPNPITKKISPRKKIIQRKSKHETKLKKLPKITQKSTHVILEHKQPSTISISKQLPIVNTRPIIGILAQEISASLSKCFPETGQHNSYIAASYVKYLEGSGARVVPIRIGQSFQYYVNMATYVNGILFPGGGAVFTANHGYADAAKIMYKKSLIHNIPIWGTCLGFEILLVLDSGVDMRYKCNVNNLAHSLKFSKGARKSKLFEGAPLDVINTLETQSVTANTHTFCISVENMTDLNLDDDWNILTTTMSSNITFVSTIESKKYPIWGTQFHPEKNSYEWGKSHIAHSKNAVKVTQYFANFFVDQARRNSNKFPNHKLEMDSLIYNFKPIYTGKNGCAVEQCYIF